MMQESKIFDVTTTQGIAQAERYQRRMYAKYESVKVIPMGFSRVKVLGVKPVVLSQRAPAGVYPGEFDLGDGARALQPRYIATGEFRAPRKGEFYLSGAIVAAYRAPKDFSESYWIAERVS